MAIFSTAKNNRLKIQKCLGILLLILNWSLATSQNLIKNGDFERYGSLGCHERINPHLLLKDCDAPYYKDMLFVRCVYDVSLKKCSTDTLAPHSGKVMIAQLTNYAHPTLKEPQPHWVASYIAMDLAQPLHPSKVYVASFWVALSPRHEDAVSGLGLALLEDFPALPHQNGPKTLDFIGADAMIDTVLKPTQWTKMSFTIQPRCKATYLLFGNFSNIENVKAEPSPFHDYVLKEPVSAEYYLDDFFLREATPAESMAFQLGKKGSIPLTAVQFEVGSSDLPASEAQKLDNMVKRLLALGATFSLTATGYADQTGKADSNLALSEQRAQRVADYLRERLPGWKIQAIGAGASKTETQQYERKVSVQMQE